MLHFGKNILIMDNRYKESFALGLMIPKKTLNFVKLYIPEGVLDLKSSKLITRSTDFYLRYSGEELLLNSSVECILITFYGDYSDSLREYGLSIHFLSYNIYILFYYL